MIRKHQNNSLCNWALVKELSNRLREMGKIQKTGRWVPHQLNDSQMLFDLHDIFSLGTKGMHRIVTKNEKWSNFENP